MCTSLPQGWTTTILNANDGGTITLTATAGAVNGNNIQITDPHLSAQHLMQLAKA